MSQTNDTGNQTILIDVACSRRREFPFVEFASGTAPTLYAGNFVKFAENGSSSSKTFGFTRTNAATDDEGSGPMVVLENAQEGLDYLETTYTGVVAASSTADNPGGDRVYVQALVPGDIVLARLAANEADIGAGDQMGYDTNGTLREVATANTAVVAIALETSATSSSARYIKVQIV